MISNAQSMKCGGQCENLELRMGEYSLRKHMFSIEIGKCDIILGVGWRRTLGPITMDIVELYMSFQKDDNSYKLKGLKVGSPKIINSHHHYGIIAQFHVIQTLGTLLIQFI